MLFSSSLFAIAVAPLLTHAAPARFRRAASASDITVFKFADVLEQLESSFYSQAIAKFQASDFTAAGFSSSQIPVEQFTAIQTDEATHSSVLQSALQSFGEQPITSCKFNFDSVLTDVATMAAVARVVENVGVAAYLGGATLLDDPVLLTAAGSILTVEARHQTILNILSSTGTAIPSAFDIALKPQEVLAIASPFFDGPCDVGLPANPSLSITNTGSVGPGTALTFSSSALNGTVSEDNLFCQMLIGGASNSIALPFSQCVVPQGINGPVAIFVTSDGNPLINNVRDRATDKLIAGPTMAFIDTQPQVLGQLARGSGGGAGAATTTSTSTISPAEASSIISSASATTGATDAPAATTAATDASASTTGSAEAPASTSNQSSTGPSAGAAAVPGTPNTFTGPSPDGKLTVVGWNM